MTKEERIKEKKLKLQPIYEYIVGEKQTFAKELIANASFMAVTLEDLQKQINEEGAVITSTNGNGFQTVQEHPAQKAYNTMVKNYNSTVKQLTDMLPTDKAESSAKAGEALKAFIAKGKGCDVE